MSEPSAWPVFEKQPRVAFIDVDGTLLAHTTSYMFARILAKRGMLRRSVLLRAVFYGLQHRFGRLDYGRLIEGGLDCLRHIPLVDLERIAYENFVEYVKPRLFEGVVEHLNRLRQDGTSILLVSSSPGFVIEPLSLYLGCIGTITTPVVIERGRLARQGSGPPCYGDGKLYWVEHWLEAHGVELADSVAYADNWSDRALLLKAGQAVVVNPKGRLLRLAREQGWFIARPRRPVVPSRNG